MTPPLGVARVNTVRSPLCLSSRFRRNLTAPSTALFLVLLAGCGGGEGIILPGDGEPAAIAVVLGNDQRGLVGEPLKDSLVVLVTDSRGRPVEGATVAFDFSSAGAGAAVVPEEKTTDGDGLAAARLVLGTRIGRQTGQARLVLAEGRGPVQTSFSAMALPENANTMAAVAGQDQTGHVGLPLDDRLVVEVTDGFGNPVAGVPITWVAEGGGSVSEAIVETDEDGRSRVDRTLGPTVGQQSTVASSDGLAGSPVTFLHTALAGDASRLVIISGSDQTAEAGSTLPAELVAQLVDADGNGVPQTAVSWVVATGGGAATPEITTTDDDGRTSARWTLGATLGLQRLDAVVSGVGIASFRATAVTGAPPSLFIRTQPPATARNGIAFTRQPVLQLRNPQGGDAAQAGVVVTVAIGSGGGELSGTRQVSTDGSGQATFTNLSISGAPGLRTLVFTAPGFAQVASSEIDLQAVGTATTIISDFPDPSGVGAAFTVSFQVGSQGPTPTGSVTVGDGTQSCSGSLAAGAGSCQLALTTPGGRTLTAVYSGAPGLLGSSDTEPHTVTSAPPPPPAGTATTITDDTPDPSIAGTRFTVRFTVTSAGTTPSGSVRVTVSDGTPSCSGTLSGGVGSCDLTLNTVGDRTLTATYSGGPGLEGSSDTEPHRVNAAPPDNEEPFADFNWHCEGLTCHFTDASRDDDGNIATRHWDFGDGATTDNELNPSHTYAGPGHFRVVLTVTDNGGLTDDASDTVDPESPPPPNQAPVAEFTSQCDELDCQFRDQSTDGDGRIEGRAWTFGDGGTSDARDPRHAYSSDGTYQVTLTATDDDGGTDAVTHAVTVAAAPPPPAATTTSITSDVPDPSDPGQPITVSFTVVSGSGTPTGTVQVTDQNGGSCSASVATGSCDLTPAGTGPRTITATYPGNLSFNGSSDTEQHTVTTPPAATTTTITSDAPDPSNPGESVTVSFAVSSGAGTPSGSVTVSDGVDSCTGNLAGGSGSCPLVLTTSGSRTLTATYGGNSSFSGSAGTEPHTVNPPPPPPPASTSTTISGVNPEPSDPDQAVTVSFTVTSGPITPTGTVLVTDEIGGNCSADATAGQCDYTPTGTGVRTITATYEGNSSFLSSVGTGQHVVSDVAPPGP